MVILEIVYNSERTCRHMPGGGEPVALKGPRFKPLGMHLPILSLPGFRGKFVGGSFRDKSLLA